MARPPSMFVRELSAEEAHKLRRISRQSKVFALRQRAQILLASDARSAAPEIARVLGTDENQVRRVIAEFNADGMASVRPRIGGGRPRRIDDAIRQEIRAIALARPRDLGEPATRWSLTTLRRYLVRKRVVSAISKEHLRRVLQSLGITAQRTRTWKWSNDPGFEAKKTWVLGAYRAAEAGTIDGVVVCFDECGPISLKPHAGAGWFAKGRPARQRATYHRHSGTRKLLGAYDVGADRLWGRVEKRRVTAAVVLEFLKDIRRRYPAEVTVYIVMDNLSAHWTPDIRRWALGANVGLLATPTNASHLNRIECHFWAFGEFVIKGSDYADWSEFTKAAQAYLRRRNRDRHDPRIIEMENRRKVA
ncbi:MAG TPA: IS630 family transposase [Acidimicrobiales bacterium]|nr:IS630 family transposase [Acidimicrobiales bacterium]